MNFLTVDDIGCVSVTEKKQIFSVYELNEFNRDSPAVLEFSRQTVNKIDPDTGAHIHALGDQVQFTNTVGSLEYEHLLFRRHTNASAHEYAGSTFYNLGKKARYKLPVGIIIV